MDALTAINSLTIDGDNVVSPSKAYAGMVIELDRPLKR